MKPVDGEQLALWFRQQLRPQISADVARYVAEFDQFRDTLEHMSSAERGAYLDLPKQLKHQWDILAPAELKPGKVVTFQVQVDSDLGPMVIGSYRVPLGMDQRLRIEDGAVEWIPSFQRGCPTPHRPGEPPAPRRKEATTGLSSLTGFLVSIADTLEERRDGVLEALEADAAPFMSAGYTRHEMPVYRSTKDALHKRAGESAKAAVSRLSIPWDSATNDLSDSERLYAWLKRAQEPVWITKLPDSHRNKLYDLLRKQGGDLYKQFSVQWEERHDTKPTQDDFWGYLAFWSTSQEGVQAHCSKFNKGIKLDEEGVCKNTSCEIHPTVNRSVYSKKVCPYQRIKIG